MKLELVVFFVPLIVVAVFFQFLPLFTRRGIFFSATVDAGFPQSADGRRVLRSYRWQAAAWSAIAIALAVWLTPHHPRWAGFTPEWLLLAGLGISYWRKFREVHARYGVRKAELRQADLAADERKAQGVGFWIWVPPFVAIAALALYLHLHWNQLPNPYPVHFGLHGEPNRWASRDWTRVYGPLLVVTAMNLVFVGLSWIFARQSRRTVMRVISIRYLQVMIYPVTFTFVLISLLPIWPQSPIWLGPVVTFASIAVLIYWSYRKLTSAVASDETPEPTSDRYWKAGMFYYNPGDPAIFVAKRVGIGYTMNFASTWAWVILLGTLTVLLLPIILLRHPHL